MALYIKHCCSPRCQDHQCRQGCQCRQHCQCRNYTHINKMQNIIKGVLNFVLIYFLQNNKVQNQEYLWKYFTFLIWTKLTSAITIVLWHKIVAMLEMFPVWQLGIHWGSLHMVKVCFIRISYGPLFMYRDFVFWMYTTTAVYSCIRPQHMFWSKYLYK